MKYTVSAKGIERITNHLKDRGSFETNDFKKVMRGIRRAVKRGKADIRVVILLTIENDEDSD